MKLVIEDHRNVFIYGICDDDERRFHIALPYPDFRNDESYEKGVGILTRIDARNVIVAQRVLLSSERIAMDDPDVRTHMLDLLSDSNRAWHVWADASVDNRFRTGNWLEKDVLIRR